MKNKMKDMFKKVYDFKIKHRKDIMTILLIIIIPGFVSIILGIEMQSNQIKNIPTVIMDHDNSAFSRMLVDEIKTNEIFNIIDYGYSDEDVKNAIGHSKAMVGVIIPESFSNDLNKGIGPKILVFYDGSSMSVTSAAKARMDEILLTMKAAYMKKILEGKFNIVSRESIKQIQPMSVTYRILNNPAKNYRNFLLPGMLIAIIQVGLVIMGVEKVRNVSNKFSDFISTNVIWGLIGMISIVLIFLIQFLFFGLPYKGSLVAGLMITLLYSIGMTAFGMMVSLIIPDIVFATQVASVLVLPTSILGGYTFPLLSMPDFFQRLGKLFPYTYFAEGIRDLCMKPLSFNHIIPSILWLFGFVCFEWLAGLIIIKIKEKYSKKYSNNTTEAVI